MRLSLFESLDKLITTQWDEDWVTECLSLGLIRLYSKLLDGYGIEDTKKVIAWATYCFTSDSDRFFLKSDFGENKRIVQAQFEIDDDLYKKLRRDKTVQSLCLMILYASSNSDVVDYIQLKQAKENLLEASNEPCNAADAEERKAHYSTVSDCALKAAKIGERVSKLYEKIKPHLETINEAHQDLVSESYEERLLKLTGN